MSSELILKNVLVKLVATGEVREYGLLAAAKDESFLILSEGPGLSVKVVRSRSAANPCWRLDGWEVEIILKEEEKEKNGSQVRTPHRRKRVDRAQ